jgi:hypothetical protein
VLLVIAKGAAPLQDGGGGAFEELNSGR